MSLTTRVDVATTPRTVLRVILLSSHPLVAAGLGALLGTVRSGTVLVGVLASVDALLEGTGCPAADVVLVDGTCTACPDGAGAAAAARLHAAGFAVLVLLGSSPALPEQLPPGVGRSTLCVSPCQLAQALRRAAHRRPLEHAGAPSVTLQPSTSPALSPRERQVLALYARDLPAKSVARRLRITEGTVKEYLRRVRDKLEAAEAAGRTKLQLRDAAEAMGLLED